MGLQAICNSLIKGGRISDATAILASLEKKIPNSSETTATDFNDGGHAKKAFKDLIQALHNEKLEPFLISGTLLGWVRNRNLLPHDKDIDIGLISSGDHSTVRKALINSKNFSFDERVLDNPNAYLLQLKHKETKTHADIFFFHEKEDCYIHGIDSLFGYTQNFRFSKFKTSTVEFLDENVKIPDDYDLFLRENYGDQWKIPDKNYIVNLESPALTIKSGELYRFIAHLELLRAKKNPAKRERILNIINAHEA